MKPFIRVKITNPGIQALTNDSCLECPACGCADETKLVFDDLPVKKRRNVNSYYADILCLMCGSSFTIERDGESVEEYVSIAESNACRTYNQ